MKRSFAILYAVLGLAAGNASAHGGHAGAHPIGPARDSEGVSFGRPGDAKAVTRTFRVEMSDKTCSLPLELRLRRGETARFVARNSGKLTHELVLGTSHELAQHAKAADRDPDLEHDAPYILHVEPGSVGEIVWEFTRIGIFGYGCLIHGSGEFRMPGRILVWR